MRHFMLRAIIAIAGMGLGSAEVWAQQWRLDRPVPLGDFEAWNNNRVDFHREQDRLADERLRRDLEAARRRGVFDGARNRPEPPPSQNLPLLIGRWTARTQDADGTNWIGTVTYQPNQRLVASFRGRSPWGAVAQQNFAANFDYYANGNIRVVVDRPFEIQVNRIDWVNNNRFIVTPRSGPRLTYDRVR